jgi:hypothetical protein
MILIHPSLSRYSAVESDRHEIAGQRAIGEGNAHSRIDELQNCRSGAAMSGSRWPAAKCRNPVEVGVQPKSFLSRSQWNYRLAGMSRVSEIDCRTQIVECSA